jgi:ATP-binding cassette subfamily F protein 3
LVEYPGSLKEYYRHLEECERNSHQEPKHPLKNRKIPASPADKEEAESSTKKPRKKDKRKEAEKRQRIHDILTPIRKSLEQTETAISQLETRQKEVEELLADPKIFEDSTKSVPLLTEYKELTSKLDIQLEKWEECHDKMASAKSRLEI